MKKTEGKVTVTADQKQTWLEEYGEIKRVAVKMKNGEKQEFIIGKPTRTHLDAIAKYNNEGKSHKVRDVLEGCILAGPVDLVKDPKQADLANTLYGHITDLLEKLESEVGEV